MRLLSVLSSAVVSVALGGRGVRKTTKRAGQPEKLLELYSFEGCPACRLVRERLTELDLDYIHRSCPRGASGNRKRLRELGGKIQVPYLVDPNTCTTMYESDDIARYLDRTYGT